MSRYTIGQLANPRSSETHIYRGFTKRLGISSSTNIQVVALTAFAGLASILGLGIATPLIFRTIMAYGLVAISKNPLADSVDIAITDCFDACTFNHETNNNGIPLNVDDFLYTLENYGNSGKWPENSTFSKEHHELERSLEIIKKKYHNRDEGHILVSQYVQTNFIERVEQKMQ